MLQPAQHWYGSIMKRSRTIQLIKDPPRKRALHKGSLFFSFPDDSGSSRVLYSRVPCLLDFMSRQGSILETGLNLKTGLNLGVATDNV